MFFAMGLQMLIKAPIMAIWAVSKILNKSIGGVNDVHVADLAVDLGFGQAQLILHPFGEHLEPFLGDGVRHLIDLADIADGIDDFDGILGHVVDD